jgi:hypothetical protein
MLLRAAGAGGDARGGWAPSPAARAAAKPYPSLCQFSSRSLPLVLAVISDSKSWVSFIIRAPPSFLLPGGSLVKNCDIHIWLIYLVVICI